VPTSSDRKAPREAADSVAKAVGHRIRVDILTVLHDGPASQKDLSKLLGLPLSNINHHMNELIDEKAVEVAFTKLAGGQEQNYWRSIRTSTYYAEDLAKLSREEHQMLSRVILQSIMAESLASLRAGKLAGDIYAVTAWDRIWLDQRGYEDMYENTSRFWNRMYEIAAESAARAADTPRDLRPYIGAVMSFPRSRTGPSTSTAVGHLGDEGTQDRI
jgi:DNA-binding transcriptional ArsR family regulator